MIQQRTLAELQEPQMRRDSRIRFAYGNCCKAVKGMLSGTEIQHFYNVSRRVCPLKPWQKFLAPLALVARKAAQDGRPIVVEQTRALLKETFETAEASVLSLLPPPPEALSILAAIRAETEKECASDPLEQEAFRDSSSANLEKALPALRLHRDAVATVILAFERDLNTSSRK